MRRFVYLEKNMLCQILRLCGVPKCTIDHIHHRLLVLLNQRFKSGAIPLLDPQHQGSIRIQMV